MNKKTRVKPTTISLDFGLEYGPIEQVDTNSPDYLFKMGAICDNPNVGKELKQARLSLKCEMPIEGHTIKEMHLKCMLLKDNEIVSPFLAKAVFLQNYMKENYRDSHRAISDEFSDISVNWMDSAVFHKTHLYFFGMCCKSLKGFEHDENIFLQFLEDMIGEEPDEQNNLIVKFNPTIHFLSWNYLLNDSKPATKQNYFAFIKHRKNQLRKFNPEFA